MLWRLLGLLVLPSLGSAMMKLHNYSAESSEEDGSTMDPNTVHWPGSPIRQTWPPNDNSTDGSNQETLRMLGATGPWKPPMPDMSVCEMLMNKPEPPSFQEIPSFCLCWHCKGKEGPKGDRGDRGPPGAPGSPGRRGMMGFKGRPGFTGSQGIKGQKGDLGEKGQSGAMGFTGMKGARGFKGEKGDRGVMGPAGAQGPQGETGTCPDSCESVQGPPGQQGVPGPVGARGLPGVQGPMGSKGLKGNKGDMGRPGDPGRDGEKGDQGEQGICDCKDGADGDDGTPGEKGATGEKGDTGAQGDHGPMGPKGNQGDMGFMGPPGPCSPAIQSAFTARIVESFPLPNLPVPFPSVLYNMQGHFNPNIGMYTAPVNGTYVFGFHLAVAERPLKVGLYVNFVPIVRATEVTDKSTTSQTIVLHLNMGDRVWLQVKNTDNNGMFTDRESISTLTGYLLNPDSCDWPRARHHMHEAHDNDGDYSWDGPEGTTPSPQ